MSCQTESDGSADCAGDGEFGEGAAGEEEALGSVGETRNLVSWVFCQMYVW